MNEHLRQTGNVDRSQNAWLDRTVDFLRKNAAVLAVTTAGIASAGCGGKVEECNITVRVVNETPTGVDGDTSDGVADSGRDSLPMDAGIIDSKDAGETSDAADADVPVSSEKIGLTVDPDSSTGDKIKVGALDGVCGRFVLNNIGKSTTEFRGLELDLSSNDKTAATRPQDKTGHMECPKASECDLVGSVKISIGGKIVLAIPAASDSTSGLWDVEKLAGYGLSSFVTIPPGFGTDLTVYCSTSALHTGPGEQIRVGVKNVYYYDQGDSSFKTTATKLVQANPVIVE